MTLEINSSRFLSRMEQMSAIGKDGIGVHRLALSKEDGQARDLLTEWMTEAGLRVTVDQIGNMYGSRGSGSREIAFGSHLDTVNHGGRFDGSLGVLASLEVMESVKDAGIEPEAILTMVNFTNEEGARFTPDMMGSMVISGDMTLEDAWRSHDVSDPSILAKDELDRIGYLGDVAPGDFRPDAFLELHIEQGPTLGMENAVVGVVEKVQGIKWFEFGIAGQANHAGPTPMEMRHDAGLLASKINVFVRQLTATHPSLRGTAGFIEFYPNQINIIPGKATIRVDLRCPDGDVLQQAEQDLMSFVNQDHEGVSVETSKLTDVDPVSFDQHVVKSIAKAAEVLDLPSKHMISGASHDAQLMAGVCPTAMIFIPSRDGISHDAAEYSSPEDCVHGANVLLNAVLDLASN